MHRTRRPRQSYERWRTMHWTPKQRIHQLLRRDPDMTVEQLAQTVGCTRAYARIWLRNFYAPGHEPPQLLPQEL
jgi:hypothetical protein